MKNFTIAVIVFVSLPMVIFPVSLSAQSSKDVPDDKDKLLKQMIELSKTGQNHVLLSGLTGTWTFNGRHFPPDPDKKPLEFKGTAERKSIMDGRYFIFETTGGALKMPWSNGKEVLYKDMSVEGYDNNKKKFVSAMIANHWNTGIVTSEGRYDPGTGTITYHSETEQADGMKTKMQTLVKIRNNDHYMVEIYRISGDKPIRITEINYTRQAAVPDAGNGKANVIPGEYHKMLARSVGKWTGEASVWLSPDAVPINGGTSILVNKMSTDGLYQISEIIGNPPPGAEKAWTGLRITGYDNDRKVFTRAMIGDGNSAGGVAMEGRWDEATRSITMPFKKADPSTGKERNLKEVYKIVDENTEVLEIYATDEKTGKEFKVLNVKWTRKQ